MICYPFMFGTCAQVTTPLVYDESISTVQQMAALCAAVNKIAAEAATESDLENLVREINADQEEQTEKLTEYVDTEVTNLDQKWQALISNVKEGQLVWDVTLGRWNDPVDAMRNLFNDVTLHSVSVDVLAEMPVTVDEVAESGLNVRGLAVYAGYLDPTYLPDGVGYVEPPPTDYPLDVAGLAAAEIRDGYFVTEGDEPATTAKLATARVDGDYIKED